MTKHVSDEVLGKLARQQHDVFERVKKGSLDANEVRRTTQQLIDRGNIHFIIPVIPDFELALGAGRYDNVFLDHENYPYNEEGATQEHEMEATLIHFNREITPEEAIKAIQKKGYQPAQLAHLLGCGIAEPELQLKFHIIAIGCIDGNAPEGPQIPTLCEGYNPYERKLTGHLFPSGTIDAQDRFLVVRPLPEQKFKPIAV